jgi:hypothetical protein
VLFVWDDMFVARTQEIKFGWKKEGMAPEKYFFLHCLWSSSSYICKLVLKYIRINYFYLYSILEVNPLVGSKPETT